MSRLSTDDIKGGYVWNGFDYSLQVWVKDGIIQDVGLGRHLAGESILEQADAERR